MLENVPLFADLEPERLAELERQGVVRRYPKNSILVLEGDTQSHLFVIRSGKVRVFSEGADGKQVILNHMGPGEYFGELSLLDAHPRSASISTVTECELLTLSGEVFQRFIEEHPSVMTTLTKHLVATIRGLTSSVKDLALLDVYGRVRGVLERLAAAEDNTPPVKMTHQDIANMVGASREMVSKIMKELTQGEYIEQACGRIVIKRPLPQHW